LFGNQKSLLILLSCRYRFEKRFERLKMVNFAGRRKPVRRRTRDKKARPKSETPQNAQLAFVFFLLDNLEEAFHRLRFNFMNSFPF